MDGVHRDDRDAAIEDIAALDQPVRRAIYDLLVERDDWVGRDDAAETLDMPRSVAAFHLDKLVEAELGHGRPPRF
jgi:predicted ArsR family transcriptional regulator